MDTQYFPDDDILYVQIKNTPITGGKQLDDDRHLDLDEVGDIRGIVFQGVSDGVDLEGIPAEALPTVEQQLQLRNIKVKEAA